MLGAEHGQSMDLMFSIDKRYSDVLFKQCMCGCRCKWSITLDAKDDLQHVICLQHEHVGRC